MLDCRNTSNEALMSKAMACALAAVLAGAACAPVAAAYADEPQPIEAQAQDNGGAAVPAADATYTKDESVYGTLNATGAVKRLYVVNQFNVSSGGIIVDHGAYDAVENLTDTSSIETTGAEQTFSTEEGVFYYQGETAAAPLPWNVFVSYQLDGKDVSAEELAGASGHVSVSLATSKNSQVDPVFYDNYMLQVSFTVPTASCQNIDTADAGIIADAGDDRQITYTVMPGKDGDLTFEADVTDFEMSAVQIAGAPFSMSMDDFDTSGMADGMQQLADGVASLDDGTQELASGTGQFASGVGQVADGTGSLASGAQSISGALSQLAPAAAQVASGMGDLANGLSAVSANSSSLTGAAQGVASDAASLQAALAGIDTSAMDPAVAASIASLQAQAGNLSQSASGAAQAAASYAGSVDSLASGAQGLASGSASVSSGLSQTAGGAGSLASGASELSSGVSELSSGAQGLADGTSQLADGTSQMAESTAELPTKMQEEIDAAMASYQGDFDPVSFVSGENGSTELVQFVLTTPAIEIPDEDIPVEEEPAPGFVERVGNLFSGLFS